MAKDYQHLIDALRDAPTSFDPNDPNPPQVYTVFGPGGASWAELASIIETLRDQAAAVDLKDIQTIMEADFPDPEEDFGIEPKYEYAHVNKTAAYKLLADPSLNGWYNSLEDALLHKPKDLPESFLAIVARTKAGSVFEIPFEGVTHE